MPLRCLLFSSDEAMAALIREVLTELGVEAEHCPNPVDAVEKVTTQLFQIVITDWQDQPEAAFLLKTARDLKAAARPLTLAIVNEEGRPHALQAGANSVLMRPIRPEQVRETMSTACELLKSKLQTVTPGSARTTAQPITSGTGTGAAAAPALMVQAPEKLRAGEFLQSARSAPGAQFDTESETREFIEPSGAPQDSLTDLEPMAAAVSENPEAKLEPELKRREPLTGWAALQARLTKTAPAPPPTATEAGGKSELLLYEDATSFTPPPVASEKPKFAMKLERQTDIRTEAVSASPSSQRVEEESSDLAPAVMKPRPKRSKFYVLALALVVMALVAVPRTREKLRGLSRMGARAALRWLNPPPAPLPQTVTQHDSFGLPDDEYKLPTTANIPDSTTDPSQIQVVPVVDPTAKPDKSSASGGGQAQTAAGGQPSAGEQPPTTSSQGASPNQNSAASAPNAQTQAVAAPEGAAPINSATPTVGDAAVPATATAAAPPQSRALQSSSSQLPAAMAQPAAAQPAFPVPARNNSAPPHVPASEMAGIPSSLKSQVASTTPEMSGAKPDDAAESSIGPVTLPESAIRGLLAQAPVPEYPAAAKASGQQGSVVLQVLIGPDGTVQDAKFMQGSFIFAQAAIDAVRQWRFRPYSMNGHPVPVQSAVTLNFKP
ncbi:MAG: TonB family protein [Candidatus Sulfotelmatobacter sp.]